jgi:hypothetical protein
MIYAQIRFRISNVDTFAIFPVKAQKILNKFNCHRSIKIGGRLPEYFVPLPGSCPLNLFKGTAGLPPTEKRRAEDFNCG